MSKDVVNKREKAAAALRYILPLLKNHDLCWCISGGFACYLYGVDRPIQAIDLDVDIDKDDPRFQELIEDVKPFTKLPFQRWVDKNYDNWVMDVVIDNQLLSICDTLHLKLFNKQTGKYELFYKDGMPNPTIIEFEKLQLRVAPKDNVFRMKGSLAHKKAIDNVDISGMKRLIGS